MKAPISPQVDTRIQALSARSHFATLAALMLGITTAFATPPALRTQVSLNGNWPVGGAVPAYEGLPQFDQQRFERDVVIPADWTNQVIKVEFGAVNFIADVSVNGKPVMQHIGGWNPFAVDLTALARPGETLRLSVLVKGAKHAPIGDEKGNVLWPVGGWRERGGIADDVWLRAYGIVHVEDAFIQPLVGANRLRVDYTVRNTDATVRTIMIEADAVLPGSVSAATTLKSKPVTLAAGESKVVTVEGDGRALERYWPNRPTLYHLISRVVADGREIDRETRRFGYREIEIRGNQFFWNGVRINLYGDYQVYGDRWYLDSSKFHSPETWPATADRLLAMNMRVLRWHHNPVPQYVLDVSDEKGLLICDEAANYARDYHKETDHLRYLENAKRNIAAWIRADRNHPSIYLWNATNEMTHSFAGPFPAEKLPELGAEITRCDPTRPVGYDGDNVNVSAAIKSTPGNIVWGKNIVKNSALVDHHYPEGYNHEPIGSIYGWGLLVDPNRPTGSGELLHTRSPKPEVQQAVDRNTWWLGIWLRGLRYTDWTNVKPACWWFSDADLASANPDQRQRSINLRNALAPVALFDKAYDDLGIAPYVTETRPGGKLPVLQAGVRENRTLILYNDEFEGETIDIEVLLRSAGRELAAARGTYQLALGHHRDIACEFTVPATNGCELELVLRTTKAGKGKFEEVRRFVISGTVAAAPDIRLHK